MTTPISDERAHRRLAVDGHCPDCASPEEMRAELARPYRYEPGDGLVHLLTPQGELAGDVNGQHRPDDVDATAAALPALWPVDGPDHVNVIDTPDGPWVRGCAWICDDEHVHLSTTSYPAYQQMSYELEMLWPPVWRSMSSSEFPHWEQVGSPIGCSRPAGWPENPAHRALRELIVAAEQRWLATPTPLLDGWSPREVAGTPEGLQRVLALVRRGGTAADVGALAAFDPDRVEHLLRTAVT